MDRDGGTQKVVEVQDVLAMARSWIRDGSECDWSGAGIGDDGFDEALSKAGDRIVGIVGEEAIPDFYAAVIGEAMGAFVCAKDACGKDVMGRARLFAMPVSGLMDSIGAVFREDEKFDAFAGTFHASGLADAESRVVVLRAVIDPVDFASIMPGEMRKALTAMLPALLSGVVGDMEVDPDEILEIMKCDDAIGNGVDVGSAVVIGAHFASVGPDEIPPDFLGCLCPISVMERLVDCTTEQERDEILNEEGDVMKDSSVSEWVAAAGRLFGSGVAVEPPQTWDSTVGALATGSFFAETILAKSMHGIPVDAMADVIHYHCGEEWLTVDMEFGGSIVGPILVSMRLAACNMQAVNEALESEGEKMQRHGSVSTLPHGRSRAN